MSLPYREPTPQSQPDGLMELEEITRYGEGWQPRGPKSVARGLFPLGPKPVARGLLLDKPPRYILLFGQESESSQILRSLCNLRIGHLRNLRIGHLRNLRIDHLRNLHIDHLRNLRIGWRNLRMGWTCGWVLPNRHLKQKPSGFTIDIEVFCDA